MDEEREFVKENVRSRILSIMEREGLNAGAFATSINVARGYYLTALARPKYAKYRRTHKTSSTLSGY